MKKILAVLAGLCFLTCLIWTIQLEMDGHRTPEPQTAVSPESPAPATEPPTEAPAEVLTEAATAETEFVMPTRPAALQEPQRINLPLEFGDPAFLETLMIPVDQEASPNHELQIYKPAQVRLQGNQISMTAEEQDGKYYSGKVVSAFSFRYGTLTFRISTMDNPGLFPAVWMLPAAGGTFPEVDILEMIGKNPDELFGVLHYPMENGAGKNYKTHYFMYPYPFPDSLPEYYTLTFEWQEDSLTWYVGDQKVQTMIRNIPNEPMYLLVNLAVGGDWSGSPNANSVFPTTLNVEILDFQPEEIYTR